MKCDLNLLEDCVEGFLNEIEQKKVEAHLQACENCQLEYEQLQNEQNALFAQLNKPRMANSQAEAIMQHIQINTKRKKSWHNLKMTVISAAALMLSIALYYWSGPANELAQPLNEPQKLVEPTNSEQEERVEGEQLLDYNEPFLDVSIDSVVENKENYDIYYRVKFKEQYQKEQNHLYEQLLRKYQYKEVANVPRAEDGQDDFFGDVRTKIQFAIRDEKGQLIRATMKTKDGEQPLINDFFFSGDDTETLGEMIYTTSVPKNMNPSTFEVLQMEANIFNLYETEVNTAQLQPFELNDVTYEVDSIEIENKTMYLKIFTRGEPENSAYFWHLDINNRLINFNAGNVNYNDDRTVYTYEFENFEKIPNNFKLVPLTVRVKKQVEPIQLKLH